MVLCDIDNDTYGFVKLICEKDHVEYPSIKNFINRAVKDKVRIEIIGRKEIEQKVDVKE